MRSTTSTPAFAGGAHDLGHRAGPVGPGRVDVDDAGQVAHVASMTLWQSSRVPRRVGIRPVPRVRRGQFALAARAAARGDPLRRRAVPRALQGAGPGPRGADGGPRFRGLPGQVRIRRGRQGDQPLHQHPQPPRRRAVRGLRGRGEDARLGADRAGGLARGAVLRAALREVRRDLREDRREVLQHRRRGAREGRPDPRGRRLRLVRPPACPGHAPADGHDEARGRRVARRRSRSSRTPSSSASARRWTRSIRSTRCSGRGTCRAGWTT